MPKPGSTAAYVRRSTAKQETEHQRTAIREWLGDHDLSVGDIDTYEEQASGASADRDAFLSLVDAIEAGEYGDVVVWEISRIARKGFLAQRFFDAAEDNGATIHVTDGAVRKVEPDGHGRLVADIIAAVAAEERRSLIRRTKAGVDQAISEGKWVGTAPIGFVTVDGYLRPNLQPDYADGETGFHDIAEALENIADGQSYRKAAQATPNVTRQTLSSIDQKPQRRKWYVEHDAEDDRVQAAVSEVEE